MFTALFKRNREKLSSGHCETPCNAAKEESTFQVDLPVHGASKDDIYKKDEERMTEMQNLVDRLQCKSRDKSIIIEDLKQEGVSNVFSEEPKRRLKEMDRSRQNNSLSYMLDAFQRRGDKFTADAVSVLCLRVNPQSASWRKHWQQWRESKVPRSTPSAVLSSVPRRHRKHLLSSRRSEIASSSWLEPEPIWRNWTPSEAWSQRTSRKGRSDWNR